MRIAIVAQNLVYGDGQGRINLEIARQALRAGHEVTLVSVVVDPELVRLGATWEVVKVRKWPILLRVAHFPLVANRIIDRLRAEDRIDFVIANGYTLTRPHDVNLCQFVHSAWKQTEIYKTSARNNVDRFYQSFYTNYNAYHEVRSYRAARTVVAPSWQTVNELRNLGFGDQKLQMIPNGVDCTEFSPGREDRKAMGLPEGVPMILFVGDVRTNRKGLGSLLQAMTMLPEVHLAVVGKSTGSPFIQLAHDLNVAERTHFLGFRREVPTIMRMCDLFVFPSWYDPFGLVVTEALACGLPVVTTGTCGAGELLMPACGTVVRQPPSDTAALAGAIREWIDDPFRRIKAGALCRAIAQNNGWVTMARHYLDLLAPARAAAEENQSAPPPAALLPN